PPWNNALPATETVFIPCETWNMPEVCVRFPLMARSFATRRIEPLDFDTMTLGSAAVDEIVACIELPSTTTVPVPESDPVTGELLGKVGGPAPSARVAPEVRDTGRFASRVCEPRFREPSIVRIQFTVSGEITVTLAFATIPSWSKGAAAERVCGDVPWKKT